MRWALRAAQTSVLLSPWRRGEALVVVEFLPRIPAGMDSQEFMAGLERVVEDNSNRLMAEAGLELPESRG